MGCITSSLQPKSADTLTGTMKVADPAYSEKASLTAAEPPAEKDLAVPSIALSTTESGVMDTLRKISMSSLSKVSASQFHKVSSTLTFWRPSATMEDAPLLHHATPGMEDFDRRLTTSTGSRTCFLPTSQYILRYAHATVCGWYPGSIYKDNQDAVVALEAFGGDVEQVFFGVFDGHGEHGHRCSEFAKSKIPELLLSSPYYPSDPCKAFHEAMTATNAELRDHAEVDDYSSGTTAVAVVVNGLKVYISNVGDSRCVLAKKEEDGRVVAVNMSNDHTPYRLDEMERVKEAGARVLTMQQVEGKKDADAIVWGAEETAEEADPPRLWLPEDPLPGTAFTRSIGDALAETIGVIPDPEVTEFAVTEATPFLIMATDGVFEFMTSQVVVDMVVANERPDLACVEIAKAAYQNWLDAENRVDDITVIIAEFVGVQHKGPAPSAPRGSAPAPVRVPSNASIDFERSKSQKQAAKVAATAAVPEEEVCLLKVPEHEPAAESSTSSSPSSSLDEELPAQKQGSADGPAVDKSEPGTTETSPAVEAPVASIAAKSDTTETSPPVNAPVNRIAAQSGTTETSLAVEAPVASVAAEPNTTQATPAVEAPGTSLAAQSGTTETSPAIEGPVTSIAAQSDLSPTTDTPATSDVVPPLASSPPGTKDINSFPVSPARSEATISPLVTDEPAQATAIPAATPEKPGAVVSPPSDATSLVEPDNEAVVVPAVVAHEGVGSTAAGNGGLDVEDITVAVKDAAIAGLAGGEAVGSAPTAIDVVGSK